MKKLLNLWQNPRVRRVVTYLFFGGLTTVVNWGLYFVFTRGFDWYETPSNIAAVLCAVIFAYITNRRFVFLSDRPNIFKEMLSFFGARGLTIALDIGGFYVLSDILGFYDLIVKFGLNVLVVLLNYVLSRFFVFKNVEH
ncbi:membrane protein [Clostridia bacterium]|nr:membrane protein [Clostridia bacterium]